MGMTIEKISALVRAQESSGLSIAKFCTERGIVPASFYEWRRRVKGQNAFAEVVTDDSRIELVLSSGKKIRVHTKDLKVVLEALG